MTVMNDITLNKNERERYARHIMIPEIGTKGQIKLKQSKVLVVGAGGLGCPVLQYLCAAGVGSIGIVEFDVVNNSNLQRQILYGSNDVGKLKSIITRDRLYQQNNNVSIEIFNLRLSQQNASGIIGKYDVIIDATDNYEARYVINDACVSTGKPMVHGAIYKFEGQVSVFNYKNGPSYRDFNPEKDNRLMKNPDPADSGLIGVLPGIAGTIMATEAIKIILKLEGILSGVVLQFNIIDYSFSRFRITQKTIDQNL